MGTSWDLGFPRVTRDITPRMENEMEQRVVNEMNNCITWCFALYRGWGLKGIGGAVFRVTRAKVAQVLRFICGSTRVQGCIG